MGTWVRIVAAVSWGLGRSALRHGPVVVGGALAICAAVCIMALHPQAAAAATITVTNTNDMIATRDGVSLREAIASINAGASVNADVVPTGAAYGTDDTITFSLPNPATITLGSELPAIAKPVTITGPGAAALTVSGNNAVTVFTVNSGQTVAIGGVTIANGTATEMCNGSPCGGGIHNSGTLTVTNSTFSGNTASNNGEGGGIFTFGTLTVTNSTFSGDSASGLGGAGGGIYNHDYSTVTVTNSTFSGNTAIFGGGILNNYYGTLTVTNSTFSGNSAGNGGGGIYNGFTTVTLTNTIVAASSSGGDLSGSFTGNNNLIDDAATAGGFTDGANGNIVGHPALLGPFANYGGTTQTFSLVPDSPALDAGDNATCALGGPGNVNNLDQRGITRPQPTGGHCDIGAFEARFTLTVSGGTPQSTLLHRPFAQPLAVIFGGADAPATLSGISVIFSSHQVGGASATFIGNQTTNASGAASVSATANGTPGAYTVTASTPGAAAATFNLTNVQVTLVVNTTGDGAANFQNCATGNMNTCRLRDAIAAVTAGNTAITFALPNPATITVDSTQGALTIPQSMTITGPGATALTVCGNHLTTVFHVNSGQTVAIGGVTIANGHTNGNGGGIDNTGALTVTNSTFSGNGAAFGGGIENDSNGTLTVTSSTFSGNSASGGGGGGIANLSALPVTVTNSTFSGNTAPGGIGGGIGNNSGTLSVTNSTLTGNSGTDGGGIFNVSGNVSGTVTLTNTIVALNTASTSGPDLNGTFASGGHNLIGNIGSSSGITNGTNGDIVNPTPLLGTLGSNGGPTQTIPLLTGSPAIAHGDPTVCNHVGTGKVGGVDQRGVTRPTILCAIGAVEPLLSAISPSLGNISGGAPITLTGAGFAAGATVSFGGGGCTNVQVVNSTTLRCTVGAHAAGAVDVVVSVGSATGTLTGGYTYAVVTLLPGQQPSGPANGPPNPLPGSRPSGPTVGPAPNPLPLPQP